MTTKRNYTAELLSEQKRGKTIVCSVAPYDGMPMAYAPRTRRDPRPWAPADVAHSAYNGMYRYTGRECHAVDAS